MNCWYSIEGTKPHDFRGFDLRYIYEAYQIAPTNVFFDGTACENAGFHTSSQDASTGNGRVEVLSSSELDLTNPLLFSIAFQAKSALNTKGDTVGMMEVFRFDLNLDSGIDSVEIQNGWIKYVKVPPPPPPEKKRAIALSSDSTAIASDSVVWLTVQTSELDSARIKRGVFTFNVDTSLLQFDTAIVGKVLSDIGEKVTVDNKITFVNVFYSNTDTSKALNGAGELLKLRFTAKKRTDTVCTTLIKPLFFALNADNLLDSVRYQIAAICVLGKKPVDTRISDPEGKDLQEFSISNTIIADGSIEFHSESEIPGILKVYDALGRCVLEQRILKSVTLSHSAFASGMYKAVLTKANGKGRMGDLAIRFIVLR